MWAKNNADRLWRLRADTAEEAALLAQTMRNILNDQGSKGPPKLALGFADEQTETDDMAFSELEKEVVEGGGGAWFVKKGEGVGALTAGQRRYFVLRIGQTTGQLRMSYFVDCKDGKPSEQKGYISIGSASAFSARGKILTIVSVHV